ncbi:MAG: hypothetical protein V5A45_08585 [Haloarculaceae archaeon]
MRHSRHRTITILISLLVATALGAGVVASQPNEYAIEQGDDCYELTPVTNESQSVEAFYGYTVSADGDEANYSANTPIGLEDANSGTSSLFLYEGPDGLSLVVLHGAVNDTGGGAVSMEFVGLPEAGEWVVKDDPTNLSIEVWNRNTTEGQAVDWGWRDLWTDGGAFQGGLDDQFSIEISASFNEGAELEPVSPGNVTEWRAITVENDSLRAVTLDMNRSVTIRTGGCR